MASASGGMAQEIEQIEEIAGVESLRDYVVKLVALLLEDNGSTSDSLIRAMKERSTSDMMHKFLGDSQAKSLMIERLGSKGNWRLSIVYYKVLRK